MLTLSIKARRRELKMNTKHAIYRALKAAPLKVIAVIAAPLVFLGAYNVIRDARNNDIYAVDPLIVTYNGGPPPNPVFIVTNMLPGDEIEKEFNVKNDSPDNVDVVMKGIKTTETQEFADILEIIIGEVADADIFGGTTGFKTLEDFFVEGNISLGNVPAGGDRDFRVKVLFPSSAGNEYQNALVIFDIEWRTVIDLPDECQELEGIVTEIVEGTEGDDNIHATTAPELILAKGGNDKVDASSGSDCVVLGDGNDYVRSESGNDIVLGGNGNDKIISGSGNDTVYGGPGNDNISTGSGADKAYGGEGDDKISTGSGNDYADGESGVDNISGGSGTDTCLNEETASSCEF